ncbi:hypothetical protein AJ81_10145 [Pseudothermotoga hypogea DSM 11164 = NBRC 106472]|uniref:Uncharacterized protein n=2 Tax=Pseudothermotoga TaxID=1643951 RepID=A0A0X1KUG9_9THEM|nr:hypothetical protein [Pseudothermotoga hypogea]AJC74919.1 hypothetical protein AJ81_10145 [Pseudothermotoga hypogea DSM 11164 = NBRC 106472]
MKENEREKDPQDQEGESHITNQKEPVISKLTVVVLMILCSASVATSLLALLMLNHFIGATRLAIIRARDDGSLVRDIIKQADLRLSSSDYETAHLMILNSLKIFPDNAKLLNEYDQILSAVISNVDNPQAVFGILNDGETLIIKFMSEAEPSHFLSLNRILKLIRDKRSKYLENMVKYIRKLEEEGNTDRVNLLIKNFLHVFSSSRELTDNIVDLLLKRLERLSALENPSLNLAYVTLEMAVSLEERFALNAVDSTSIKDRIDRINELISDIERKELNKEVDSLCSELEREQLQPYPDMDEAELSAKVQNLLAKAQRLINNPLLENSDRERIYEGMYNVQKAMQKTLEEKSLRNLKDYNRWALEILKVYSQDWNVSQIQQYAKELGQIDTRYLFPEVNVYYNWVLSKIVEKLKKENDLKVFVDTMFNQGKRSP